MKRPHKGIRSTTSKPTRHSHLQVHLAPIPAPINQYHPVPGLIPNTDNDEPSWPALIADVDDESIANVFCVGAFASKNTGVIYNDCTGSFPFISLDGNV